MKNSELNRKNVGATGIVYKACVWILSIMLVVTGMAPSFARNAKAGNGSDIKTAQAGSDKTPDSVDKQRKDKAQNVQAPDAKKASKGNKNDRKADNNEESNINPKQVATLKDQVASKAHAVVSNGYSSYYKHLRKSTSDLQRIRSEKESNLSLKNKAVNSIKQGAPFSKLHKFQSKKKVKSASKDKDGDGKKNKFGRKGKSKKYYISEDHNIYAIYEPPENHANSAITIHSNKDPYGRAYFIDRKKFLDMMEDVNSNTLFIGNMYIKDRVYLPQNSEMLFQSFTGNIVNADMFDTSFVENMSHMFHNASTPASIDVSGWNVKKVKYTTSMFANAERIDPDVSNWEMKSLGNANNMFKNSNISKADLRRWSIYALTQNMFDGCKNLRYIKTPEGFKANINNINQNFKVMRLEKGYNPVKEHESINFSQNFTINSSGNNKYAYNIYRKDTHVGVTFRFGSADTAAYRNHEIAEKGRTINDTRGRLPEIAPHKHKVNFLGWSKSQNASESDFNQHTIVDKDIDVFPVFSKFHFENDKFPLNYEDTVFAKLSGDGNLDIETSKNDGMMYAIDRRKWNDMVKVTGGEWTNSDWGNSVITGNITVSPWVQFPNDSSFLFNKFKGNSVKCWGSATIIAENMNQMFSKSRVQVVDMKHCDIRDGAKMFNMFEQCVYLECLRLPAGLKTLVSSARGKFKIVKTKEGAEPIVEHVDKEIKYGFTINESGDSGAAYNIYRTDNYVGVTFDKNNGDTSAHRNHIVFLKGLNLRQAYERLPFNQPKKEQHHFLGWSTSRKATEPDFNNDTAVNKDMVVYAVFKRYGYYLDEFKNIEAAIGDDGNININVLNPNGNRDLDKWKWRLFVGAMGGSISGNVWESSPFEGNITVTGEVNLCQDASHMFYGFKGELIGAEKINTSKTANMNCMFEKTTKANPNVTNWDMSNVESTQNMFDSAGSATPDVSKWNVSKLTDATEMFRWSGIRKLDLSKWNASAIKNSSYMLLGCYALEYLKTPKGLKMDVGGEINNDFKVVRLKKGSEATVEHESVNLNSKISINESNDKDVTYNIYRKDKYVGVTFDKNGGDTSAYINHCIVKKGLSIKDSKEPWPAEAPKREGRKFFGWAKNPTSEDSDFDEDTIVNNDTTVYATWNDSEIPLNSTGNVKAKIGNDGNIIISVKRPKRDRNIEREKWEDMVKELGGKVYDKKDLEWNKSFKGNMKFENEVYLPQSCSYMFKRFQGKLLGTSNFNTSKVTNMWGMFYDAPLADPYVTNWDTSKVTEMTVMFKFATSAKPDPSKWNTSKVVAVNQVFQRTAIEKADLSKWDLRLAKSPGYGMFWGCYNLEYLKTPKGFKMAIGGNIYKDFKVVKLKKGSEATVEHESINLEETTTINNLADKDTTYNIYRKDKYAGVTFDKNGVDASAFRNHEIVEKGKSIKDSGGKMPEDKPEITGSKFLGWAKSKTAGAPDFDENITINDDTTVYSVWKNNTVTLDGNGGVLAAGVSAKLSVPVGGTVKEQIETAVKNNIFTKDYYRFVGFSRSKFATLPDYNLDSHIYSDTTLYAVYESKQKVTKVTIKYTDVDMDEDEVIENVPVGKPIGGKLDGHIRELDGHIFLGYSKVKGADKPNFFKNSIVTNGLVLYPVYKKIVTVDKVKVAFRLNDGTDESLKTEEVNRYDSLGDKMPTKDKMPEREGYIFTGWAKSKAARYPDFFRGTKVKGDMTVYAVWKSLYNEKLGQAVLKVTAKAKGYELTIEPPKVNLHTGFEIFRSEKKDFKPGKDNKIATVDRNTLKYTDDKADNTKTYYYVVRAIEEGEYNGTKVIYFGVLSSPAVAAPLPKDKGVTATVTGKGAVSLEFNKAIAAAKYKVTVTAPYDKKFKAIERFVEADKLVAAGADKVKASVTGLLMGKFLAFKLEALEADNTKLVEYGNSFAFMMGAVEKLTTKVNKKTRVLNVKFKAMKGVSGYEAKIVINGKVKTIKLKKGKKKLKGFVTGSIKLPKKKGNYTFTIRAFKKIGKLKYYGQAVTKTVK